MEQFFADLKFFLELGISCLANVHFPEVFLVSASIVFHGFLESGGNADVVDNKTAFFVLKDAIDSGNGLHQVVAGHGLVHIHGSEARDIKPCEPHIHHNGNLKGILVILEPACQLLSVGCVADDPLPLFRILIAACHDDFHLLFPVGTQGEDLLVDLHGNRTIVGNDHGFPGEVVLTVLFIVCHNVLAEGF